MRRSAALAALALLASCSGAREEAPLAAAALEARPGSALPLDVALRTTEGEQVRLMDFFGSRPVLLTLAYFRCRMLCGRVLEGAAEAVQRSGLRPGRDVELLTLGIDPRENASSAVARRARALAPLAAAGPDDWPFLRGDESSVRRVAEGLGFAYRYDPSTDQYAHPAVLYVLTPEGVLSDALPGVAFAPAELGEAVARAAAGSVRSDEPSSLLMRCFRYVPALRRYAGAIEWLLRAGALATLLAFGFGVRRLVRRVPAREGSP